MDKIEVSKKFNCKDILNNLKSCLINPLEGAKELNDDVKSVSITGLILTLIITFINLIITMINSLKTLSFSLTGKISYTWDFNNLKNLNYFSLIFKNFFIYALIILAIAGVFYIGSLILKKEVKYTRLLNIVFIAVIPFVIGNMIISPILGLIYAPLAIITYILSTIYSITIFSQLVNNEIKLKNMTKIYYNTACYSTLLIIIYFIMVKIVFSTISSIGSMFGRF